MSYATTLTAEELLHLNLPNKRTELVRGRLMVREPAGYRHGSVTVHITRLIANFVDEHHLGEVFAAETGFTLARNPDTVRAADVAFISNERLLDPPPIGFAEMAPDLIVEVLSPDDRPGAVLAKVADWLTAGSQLGWVIDPGKRRARIYRADGSELHVDADGTLDGESVLPGFSVALGTILA
jgi:Uma2 family endonuclease